ncbi:MAG: hypothetical protein WC718_02395 [Phycisphaerales bacterium]
MIKTTRSKENPAKSASEIFAEVIPIKRAVQAAIRDAIASTKTAQRSRRKARPKKKSA